MKKFVSMAMVAAMTTSMVPATAFAAAGDVTASASILEALELTKDAASNNPEIKDHTSDVPELRLKITEASYKSGAADSGDPAEAKVNLTLDGAEFLDDNGNRLSKDDLNKLIEIVYDKTNTMQTGGAWTANPAGKTLLNATTGDSVDIQKLEDLNAERAIKLIAKHEKQANTQMGANTVAVRFETKTATSGDLVYATKDGGMAVTVPSGAFTVNGNTAVPGVTEETVYGSIDGNGIVTLANGITVDDMIADGKAAEATIDTTANTIDGYFFIRTGSAGSYVYTPLTATQRQDLCYGTAAVHVDSYGMLENNDDEWDAADQTAFYKAIGYVQGDYGKITASASRDAITWDVAYVDDEEIEITFYGEFAEDDVIYVDLYSTLTKTSKGHTATVSVDGDLVEIDDLTYVSILGEGITASTKALANVAEEERVNLEKDLKIKSVVGNFVAGQKIELKLNNGFEFGNITNSSAAYTLYTTSEDDVIYLEVEKATDEIVVDAADIEIEAVSAKSGDVATITVKATNEDIKETKLDGAFNASTKVEVAKVVDYVVLLSVDADEDIPVIYSGVNVENYGITDDSDHLSLEVTAEESFPGAWSMRKGFNFELPDGVYVTDVTVTETENFYVNGMANEADDTEVRDAFWNAYQEGDHKGFEFEKRVFDDVDNNLRDKECATMTFQLELVADPGFVGDVNLKLTGDLVDEQEVTIAKFATPFYVEAEQNDLKIDYRYTDIPTDIVVKEAEAGLWDADKATFAFYIEGDHLTFEDDPTFTVDEASGMELKDDEIMEMSDLTNDSEDDFDVITFTVDEESDEAATVTISDMQLFMQRNIPAGAYDLEIGTSMGLGYISEVLFASKGDNTVVTVGGASDKADAPAKEDIAVDPDEDSIVDDVCDFSETVKEAFVNVVTAGREQDDASFTTKVVVPVGESYIVAGENQITLDVPAYVSAAGYTMLPVRAVATALGINNNNVIWNGETKTVTILYGQRIITMVAGQKTVNVNGSVIPASAAVEIVDGRTFLPMRDLATALGVTDITWDAATKTATLNGGVVAE